MHGALFPTFVDSIAVARQPAFLGREHQDGAEPHRDAAEDLLDAGQRRQPLLTRWRLAIERVLADVEVECGKVRVHELRQRRDDLAIVVGFVGLADLAIEFGQPVQHQPLQFRHVLGVHRLAGVVVRQRAQHPAQRIAHLAVGLGEGLDDRRADALIVGIVRARHPQPQDIGAGLLDDVLRLDAVAC